MPRILIELDFITNPGAEAFMMSDAGQKKYAKAICDAFSKYKADYDRKNAVRQASQKESRETVNEEEETVETTVEKPIENTKVDNKAPANRIYKVQILAVPKKLPANSPHLKGYKAGYYVENKLYKYTYGESSDLDEISRIRKSVSKDFKDAFIVVFENGVRVQILKGNP
jgi:N-acetylmuramoyl-L-alanine amidase